MNKLLNPPNARWLTIMLLALLPMAGFYCHASDLPWINRLAYVGVAVKEKGYHIWGCSPILGPDGKTHLFVARYPEAAKHYPGWHTQCEIAHYVGSSPEGPFHFVDVALKGTERDTWDRLSPHNPLIQQIGGEFLLFYIANNGEKYFPANQRIGLATSKTLNGPWRRVGKDGLILETPGNPSYWNFNAMNGVNNPAFLARPNGGFYLYFKSAAANLRKMGLAISENAEGPYVQLPFSVTPNGKTIEDGYAFQMNDRVCLLTTDNDGLIKKGGGLLWTSKDGILFDHVEAGFDTMDAYIPTDKLRRALNAKEPGAPPECKFERPQVLMIDGRPAYVYFASSTNILANEALGDVSVSYVMKVK